MVTHKQYAMKPDVSDAVKWATFLQSAKESRCQNQSMQDIEWGVTYI